MIFQYSTRSRWDKKKVTCLYGKAKRHWRLNKLISVYKALFGLAD
jgi:hypothetical protein